MIIVLFGQPCSGKTTLANKLAADFYIDGDHLRNMFKNKDYSKQGRINNLNRASDIATYLHYNGNNIVLSLVYPYKEAREYLNSLTNDVKWIFLLYENIDRQERGREQFHVNDFEYPTVAEALYLNTTWLTEEECIKQIYEYVGTKDSR
jgi:adenylylsulfate kinase-like enzyme